MKMLLRSKRIIIIDKCEKEKEVEGVPCKASAHRPVRRTAVYVRTPTPSAELRFKDLSYRTTLYGLLQIAYSIKWAKESVPINEW